MIKTAKVIACLYAGIVAANAMDENVIERENPDGNEKVRHSEVLGKQESNKLRFKMPFKINVQFQKINKGSDLMFPPSCHMLFGSSDLIKVPNNISLDGSNPQQGENVSHIFAVCSSLFDFDLTKLNAIKVANMYCLLYKPLAPKNLYLSNFNTQDVTNMKAMFSNCPNIKNFEIRIQPSLHKQDNRHCRN